VVGQRDIAGREQPRRVAAHVRIDREPAPSESPAFTRSKVAMFAR
jgi:hypothetical protein